MGRNRDLEQFCRCEVVYLHFAGDAVTTKTNVNDRGRRVIARAKLQRILIPNLRIASSVASLCRP